MKEELQEIIEVFCDADFRAKLRPETAEQFCPTLEEALATMEGEE